MYKITKKEKLSHNVHSMVVEASYIAAKTLPGQFVMTRFGEGGERIPLTIADSDPAAGTITLVFQEVGKTTMMMGGLSAGDALDDVVGPLGIPSHIEKLGLVICVGGGIGIAPIHPIARGFTEVGAKVVSILGARTRDLLIMEDEMRKASSEVLVCTDDGSYGQKGFVTNVLEGLIRKGAPIELVVAIGPVPMMENVCKLTKPYGLKTVVSLNPIMVDGTGMCGACRVTVGGETRFVCVDGPDFDGHQVDFGELRLRQRMYLSEEREAVESFTYVSA
ncbi:MAG TPA: sulfide/dihydroorotate dehydrogenase-like FAD/NAD-binding protein [Proteobacteria bacterium]|nr:dihydroorotate dehydrogenase B (NAD(+)), electron transfer subunit [bacterium BMS3Abin14]HDL53081.1 sulfide/dihydroorotate dehydrogenase-like FAD/NAD-binding protein [Pseudomonadota bacterium]